MGVVARKTGGTMTAPSQLGLTLQDIIMKPNSIVKWEQTGPGIWTRAPEGESTTSKTPVRKMSAANGRSASAGDPPAAWQTLHPSPAARVRA